MSANQAKELEVQLDMLYLNPSVSAVADYRYQSVHLASREIKHEGESYKKLNTKIKTDIHQLEHGTKTYATIMQCIRSYYTEPDGDFIDEKMMDIFLHEMASRKSK